MREPLWEYAVRVWDDVHTKRCCLYLQDHQGLPVATLLAALWLATAGREPDAVLARRLRDHAEQFEVDYLRPLRAVRRRVTLDCEMSELTSPIRHAELAAEKILLEQLDALSEGGVDGGPQRAMDWLQQAVPEVGDDPVLHARFATLVGYARTADMTR